MVLEQLPKCKKHNLLLEPAIRNTAPCVLYAALKIYNQNPNAVLLIAPSDHWIDDEATFLKNIKTSFNACAENDILMTLGIQPDSPNTGYGYIQFENSANDTKKVKNFTEKPNLEKAQQFLESGDYLWNAGIFVLSAKSIIASFEKSLPNMLSLFNAGIEVWNTDSETDFIKKNYEKAENISIDFGIMERADNVHVLPVDFGWNDLGTWGSLYNKLEKDFQQNAVVGADAIFRDANGNMIKTQSGKKVIIQGLNDFIIIEKEGVLLICPKKDEQDIKQITSAVKAKFGEDFV
ncbi:MAG: mannose-1-phosphate guanylyltransferase [Flavobacteriaceae bacterium]|nr:mannose-1-phosphate guanylyltransferase [Flavobacteriaceae bacterium]